MDITGSGHRESETCHRGTLDDALIVITNLQTMFVQRAKSVEPLRRNKIHSPRDPSIFDVPPPTSIDWSIYSVKTHAHTHTQTPCTPGDDSINGSKNCFAVFHHRHSPKIIIIKINIQTFYYYFYQNIIKGDDIIHFWHASIYTPITLLFHIYIFNNLFFSSKREAIIRSPNPMTRSTRTPWKLLGKIFLPGVYFLHTDLYMCTTNNNRYTCNASLLYTKKGFSAIPCNLPRASFHIWNLLLLYF
jgi:hypothetical protein